MLRDMAVACLQSEVDNLLGDALPTSQSNLANLNSIPLPSGLTSPEENIAPPPILHRLAPAATASLGTLCYHPRDLLNEVVEVSHYDASQTRLFGKPG